MHVAGLLAGNGKATSRDQTSWRKQSESGRGPDAPLNAPIIKVSLLRLVISQYLLSEMEGWRRL